MPFPDPGKSDLQVRIQLKRHALEIFSQAVAEVEAGRAVREHVRIDDDRLLIGNGEFCLSKIRRCIVVGAGKASAAMGLALEGILDQRIDGGHLNVKYGHVHPLTRIRLTEAGHPLPDHHGVDGTHQILNWVRSAGKEDLIVALFSGGGSALMPFPHEGITLADKQETVSVLMECGASIREINAIRKHLSGVKGGRLAREAFPARLVALILSDVVGDALDVIASGPTVPDPTTFLDCRNVVLKYALEKRLPESVLLLLKKGLAGKIPESPKRGDPIFENTQNVIIGSNFRALQAAKTAAERLGYHAFILSSTLQGDTGESAHFHTAVAREILTSGNPVRRPACVLSGGETTVVISGNGTGGRNQEFVLQAAFDIAGFEPMLILSAGTDGTDGPTDAAGAVADDTTISRARITGMDPVKHLENNDAYPFFKALDDLVITGPTDTNVMDLRILLLP